MPHPDPYKSVAKMIENHDLILMEAAVVERLRRSSEVDLHPMLVNAPLIYEKPGRSALSRIYNEYLDIAENADLPIFLCTPTWRTDFQRVERSKASKLINQDAAQFMAEIRSRRSNKENIKIGGLIGCKNDCYQPKERLEVKEAELYHRWQVEELVKGGVDFIIAETLPSVEESIGIARAISQFEIPYFISYVIAKDGRILDGTSLAEAFDQVDQQSQQRPLGYMVNCAYPTFLLPGDQPEEVFTRLIGFLANASSLDHCDLDGATDLMQDSVMDWSFAMTKLNRKYGIKILGGCCGTGSNHLKMLVL